MAVKGLDRLKRQLDAFPKAQLLAVRGALEESAKETRDIMRRAVRKVSGDLYRSIDYRQGPAPSTVATGAFGRGTGGKGGGVRGEFGVLFSVWAGDDMAFYARWVEFGTQPHSLTKGADISRGRRQTGTGWHPGAQANPFFYPTVRLMKRRTTGRVRRASRKAAKAIAGMS